MGSRSVYLHSPSKNMDEWNIISVETLDCLIIAALIISLVHQKLLDMSLKRSAHAAWQMKVDSPHALHFFNQLILLILALNRKVSDASGSEVKVEQSFLN